MPRIRCERCGRFGARPWYAVAGKKPKSPEENWIEKQSIVDWNTYGCYGQIVYVLDEGEKPEDWKGYYIVQANLCPDHNGCHIVLWGDTGKCDECGRYRYGAGSYFEFACEDCVVQDYYDMLYEFR